MRSEVTCQRGAEGNKIPSDLVLVFIYKCPRSYESTSETSSMIVTLCRSLTFLRQGLRCAILCEWACLISQLLDFGNIFVVPVVFIESGFACREKRVDGSNRGEDNYTLQTRIAGDFIR